jgi:DNA modification methylase
MTLLHGNNLDLLRAMPDNSVDSIVCDPPYGLGKEPDALAMLRDWIETGHHDVKSKSGFMGKTWDAFVPQPVQWRECLRVLKPGGHVLSFAGTRTHDLITMGLRIAGFEIRDQIDWIYGSGFPKSLDVGKALDKMAGAEREVVGSRNTAKGRSDGKKGYDSSDMLNSNSRDAVVDVTAPATEAAQQWDGWGTALKPALEPITLARKPLEGTVAANVLKWHTGALNVDGCRVGSEVRTYDLKGGENLNKLSRPQGADADDAKGCGAYGCGAKQVSVGTSTVSGRWPANLIHDGSDEVTGLFPESNGQLAASRSDGEDKTNLVYGKMQHNPKVMMPRDDGDNKSAARFFYAAKVSTKEREGSVHPTMKPIALMRYLCRLITPPGGTVLDPWMGSGSTGKAAALEGFDFIGMEQDAGYFAIAQARCGVTPDVVELDPYEL